MGWKTINGRSYYYRSRREGGRVRTEYMGPPDQAELFALLDADARQRCEADRERERAERKVVEDLDRELSAWYDRVEVIAEAALIAAGYHRHNRGEWRRRRDAQVQKRTGDHQSDIPRERGRD